jgi:DNA primase
MTTWIDYKALKQRVKIHDVLGHYGVLENLKQKGDNLVGPCPIHKGTNATQFHVALAKNNFNCFGDCHGGGNVIDFVAKMEGLDIRQAALKLQEWFGAGEGVQQNGNPRDHGPATEEIAARSRAPQLAEEKPEERPNPPLSFALKNLDPEHPYLSHRGFRNETMEAFGVGYCAKGLMKGRIAIPIHNADGELVAYAGRWPGDPPDGEGKYKLPAGFHKALVVFHLHRVRELAQTHGLILVEGFFDCIWLWQAGIHNAVALMGSSLSPEQEKLIVEAVGPRGTVTLMFDEDAAGWTCREDVLSRLVPQVYVKVVSLGEEGTQPDNLTEKDLQKLGLL